MKALMRVKVKEWCDLVGSTKDILDTRSTRSGLHIRWTRSVANLPNDCNFPL